MKKLITNKQGLSQLELGIMIDEKTSNHERSASMPIMAIIKLAIDLAHYHAITQSEISDFIKREHPLISESESIASVAKMSVLLNDVAYLKGFDLSVHKQSVAFNFDEFIAESYCPASCESVIVGDPLTSSGNG